MTRQTLINKSLIYLLTNFYKQEFVLFNLNASREGFVINNVRIL